MKQIFALMLFLVCSHLLLAQDQIVLKTGDEINGKVTEVLEDDIRYKKAENPDGPTYNLKKADVLFIKYQNGTKENFAAQQEKEEQQDNTLSPSKTKVNRVETPTKTKEQSEIDKSKASLPTFVFAIGSNPVTGYVFGVGSIYSERLIQSFDRMTLSFEGFNKKRTFSFETGLSFNFSAPKFIGVHIMPIGWLGGNNYVQVGLAPKIEFLTYFFLDETLLINTYTLNTMVNVNPIRNINIRVSSGFGGGFAATETVAEGILNWGLNFAIGARF